MKTTISAFDVAEHLEIDEDIQGFLKEVAEKVGVTRASLYNSLPDDGNPHLKTISKVSEVFMA